MLCWMESWIVYFTNGPYLLYFCIYFPVGFIPVRMFVETRNVVYCLS